MAGNNGLDPGNIGPVGQGALALFSKDPVGTLSKLAAARQSNAIQSDLTNYTGGYDPKTGINWASGRQIPENPIAEMSKDPMMGIFARTNPQQFLTTVASQIMAPPEAYQVTNKDGTSQTRLFTRPQIMAWQQANPEGSAVKSDNAKPLDPNTPMQTVKGFQGGREQEFVRQPGTTNWGTLGEPGAPAVMPQSDIGKMAFDMRNFMGGGSAVPGQQGSGAPNGGSLGTGVVPKASPPTQAGSAMFSPPAAAPALAQPFRAGITALPNNFAPGVSALPGQAPQAPQVSAQSAMGATPNPNGSGVPDIKSLFQAAMMKPILESQKLQGEVGLQQARNALNGMPDNLTGNDAYSWVEQNLPNGKELSAMARKVASGDQKPPPIGRPGSIGEQVQALVARAEPGVDVGQRFRTEQEYSQAGPTGKAIRAVDTTIRHADKMLQTFDEMHNGSIPVFNSIGNAASEAVGSGVPGQFNTERDAVAAEARKVFAGASGGGLSELNEWKANLPQNASPERMQKSAQALIDLLQGRIEPLLFNYNQTTGKNKTIEDFLSPDSVKIWQRVKAAAAGVKPEASAGSTPPGPAPIGRNGRPMKWVP